MQIKKALGLAAIIGLGMPIGLAAQEVPQVDVDVQSVVSGGYWQAGDLDGTLRVVIKQAGWEHVGSWAFVQWLTTDEEAQAQRLVEVVRLVDPEQDGLWSFALPEISRSEGVNRIVIEGTHVHSGVAGTFVFYVGAPGEVEVVQEGM